MAKKEKTSGRTRNWVFIVYPDSAPDNWLDILSGFHVPALVSPLHTDLNPDDTEKKPHWHVVLAYDSVKTWKQVCEDVEPLNGTIPVPVKSFRGQVRYLCHLDNPEKKQYNPDDVLTFCGLDYRELCSLQSDKYVTIGEMMDFVVQNTVTTYYELLIYAKNNKTDWFRCLCDSSSLVMIEFIKSYTWATKNNKLDEINAQESDVNRATPTGE